MGFAAIAATFFIVPLAPGSAGRPSQEQPFAPEVCDTLIKQFGLDQPLSVQYVRYLGQLARGNLGRSFALHRPVADSLADPLPPPFFLALPPLLIDFSLALPLRTYH